MDDMDNKLPEWLAKVLHDKGWTARHLARQAGLSHTTVNQILSGERKPTYETCEAIAKALSKDKEELFRLAGLSPSIPLPFQEEAEVISVLRSLSPDMRATIVQMIRSLKGTSALLKTPAPPAIMTSDPPPPTPPTLDEEIERFLADFPEQAEIIEEARAYKLSEVAIRALIYNVRLVIADPTERMSFERFQRRLSQMFEEITRAA